MDFRTAPEQNKKSLSGIKNWEIGGVERKCDLLRRVSDGNDR